MEPAGSLRAISKDLLIRQLRRNVNEEACRGHWRNVEQQQISLSQQDRVAQTTLVRMRMMRMMMQ